MLDLRCKWAKADQVAITGSTGFIGRCLIEHMGTERFAPAVIEELPARTVIVHLAANVAPTRDALLENLALDTWVLECANARGLPLIYASTNNVYPLAVDCRPEDPMRCNDEYSAAKVLAERYLADRARVPCTRLRIADVFGPGQRHGNLFRNIEKSLLCGENLTLVGAGLKTRSYIHVDDLCGVIGHLAGLMADGRVFANVVNVAYADPLTVRQILEFVSSRAKLPLRQINHDDLSSASDIRTMRANLPEGFRPRWASALDALGGYIEKLTRRGGVGR